jgi:hypothetical protein
MASDRRKFLGLLALGIPATTSAMRQSAPSTVPGSVLNVEDSENEIWFAREDLIRGVSDHLLGELFTEELANEEERKMGCAECCDCWCHFAFTNPDGSDRDDAEALRAEIRRLDLESRVILEMRKNQQLN